MISVGSIVDRASTRECEDRQSSSPEKNRTLRPTARDRALAIVAILAAWLNVRPKT